MASLVRKIENVDRVEHFDQDGGGSIVRTVYVEPYTSHSTVVTALKGTISIDQGTGKATRVLPHRDPICNWFYCTDAKVIPFDKTSIRGCMPSGFDADVRDGDTAHNGQLTACRAALDNIDDFDFANNPDTLSAQDLVVGGSIAGDNSKSAGYCGAFITATYNPLIFVTNTQKTGSSEWTGPGDGSGFDFVDPQWRPITLLTQTGRHLFFFAPSQPLTNPNIASLCGGVLDTFSKPEVVLEFTCRRLMVPYLPRNTFAMYANKISAWSETLGDSTYPTGTVRMETPEAIMKIAPDGVVYYDILMKFTFRMIYDEYYDGQVGFQKGGWIDWNHHYGIPNVRALGFDVPVQTARASYYPVCWNGGLFQQFGTNHPLYLTRDHVDLGKIPGSGGIANTGMLAMPFSVGFLQGQ